MEKLQSGMTNLCGNFLGHLVNHGLFNGVRSILLNGISGSRGILMKKPHLTAAITLATRPVIGAGEDLKQYHQIFQLAICLTLKNDAFKFYRIF